MIEEVRIAGAALRWSVIVAIPAAILVVALRGPRAGGSLALAVGLVVANAVLAAWLHGWAVRRSANAAAFMAMPSFGVRMVAMLALLVWLEGQTFIDKPVFAAAFGVAVAVGLAAEALHWRRVPWLALRLKERS